MGRRRGGAPGYHPRGDRPNAQPATTAGHHKNTSGSPTLRYLEGRAEPLDSILERLEALEQAVFGGRQPFDWPYRLRSYEETYEPDEAAS
jgi:hypothetical protein